MKDEKGLNWFQIGIAAAGVIVTALLGFGQWQLSQQQNRILDEQHRAEERRAAEANAADKKKSADNIEVQVMALVAPHLGKLRGSGTQAENSQKVVLAAAEYLTSSYDRKALAEMYQRIVGDSPSVKKEIRARVAEATAMVPEGAPWYAVLASLPANDPDDLKEAHRVANEKLRAAERLGFSQSIRIYKTKVSQNYAIVIGRELARLDAFALAASSRQKDLAADAFAQQDRSWVLIGDAPFK